MTRNEKVLNQLPQAPDSGWIPAYLLDGSGAVLFEFLYNPEQKDLSRKIYHAELQTALASVQNLQFLYAEGRELRLNNLLMESWGNKRSLRPLLEKLEALAVADVPNGKYSPTEVYFAWGSEVFGPSYIFSAIEWTETLWVGGEPAGVRLNLTLKEIPATVGTSAPTAPAQTTATDEEATAVAMLERALQTATNTFESLTSGDATSILLSERQQQDGINTAQNWLKNNLTTVSTNIKQAYRRKAYTLASDRNGVISVIDRNDTNLGSIGIYDGSAFTPTSTS